MSGEADARRTSRSALTRAIAAVPPGLQAMAASAFFFSLMAAFVKLAGVLPLFEIIFVRSLVVAVLSGAVVVRRRMDLRGAEQGLLVLRGLLGFASLSCFYFALVRLPLADALVIQFTNPVFTALVAAVLLREHIGLVETLLVLASLGGVVMVARPALVFGGAGMLDPLAVGLGLLGAVLSATAYVTVRRLREEPPMLIVFYFAVVSTLLALPLVLIDPMLPSPGMWLVLAGLGLSTHLGQVFVTWGFRLERAGRAAAVGYLQIVFAAGWGWLLFREVPDPWTWAGAAVIVASTLMLLRLHPIP